jgi:hypothetical protein
MRFKIKATLVAALSACALSGVAVASASAHQFHTNLTKEGVTAGKNINKNVYVESSEGVWKCNEDKLAGKAKAGNQAVLIETITFSGCENGVSKMELEVNAGGTAKLLNTVEVGPGGHGHCDLQLSPSKNESLPLAYFNHSSSEILETLSPSGSFELQGNVPEKSCLDKSENTWARISGEFSLGIEGAGNILQYE